MNAIRTQVEVNEHNTYRNTFSKDERIKLIMNVYICHRKKIDATHKCENLNHRVCTQCKLNDLYKEVK